MPHRVFSEVTQCLEGKAAPVIKLGFLGLAAALFAGLLVVTAGAGLAERAFPIQLLLQAAQRFVD